MSVPEAVRDINIIDGITHFQTVISETCIVSQEGKRKEEDIQNFWLERSTAS